MANTRSTQKRARQAEKRTAHNRVIKSSVKNARRSLNEALENGDKDGASSQLRVLASAADRAAKTGVLHKNAASRLKAIYTKRLAALA
jgi:small subunit ribosomal protein S20